MAKESVSAGDVLPQRQGSGENGGRPGISDGYAPQRLLHDLREEGLRGGRMRRLQRAHRRRVLQLLPVPGRVGRGQAIITTLEGLMGPNGELSDIQQAFMEETAIQCGFCIPGFIMTAVEILDRGVYYADDQLRKLLPATPATDMQEHLQGVEALMAPAAWTPYLIPLSNPLTPISMGFFEILVDPPPPPNSPLPLTDEYLHREKDHARRLGHLDDPYLPLTLKSPCTWV